MHAIVPSHVGPGNLESGVAAARYHRWRTPESRFSSLPRIHTSAAPPMSIWRRLQDSLPRFLPPIVRQVFVINSGAYVTEGARNFYELLGSRLVDPTHSAMCICVLPRSHPTGRRKKTDQSWDRVRLCQDDGIKFSNSIASHSRSIA